MELLVVVSIITLLIAILLPALSAARASAADIACRSNLKQASTAQAAYATDHRRYAALWKPGAGGPDSAFTEYLSTSASDLVDPRTVLNCTNASADELAQYAAKDATKAVGSYGMNPAVLFTHWDYMPGKVPNPSQIVLIAEQPVEQSAQAYTSEGLTSRIDPSNGWAMWRLNSGHRADRGFRHASDRGNVVMNDGHVESLDEQQLLLMGSPETWSDYSQSRWVWWDVQNNDMILPGNCACGP